jgi:antitoxin ParD1/3/4
MSRNTSVVLSDHFTEFLTRQVASGRYGSASEVVRAGLRLLEERETALEELRAEIAKGEASGEPVEFAPGEWRTAWKADLDAEGDGHADRRSSRRA